MINRRYRVLAVASHPVQYMSPVLRRLAQAPEVELRVAYCSLKGAEAMHDPEFNATVKWDVPLMDGYDWVEVENRGSGAESLFGLYNPGLWNEIRTGNYDAVLCYVGYVRASFWISYVARLRIAIVSDKDLFRPGGSNCFSTSWDCGELSITYGRRQALSDIRRRRTVLFLERVRFVRIDC